MRGKMIDIYNYINEDDLSNDLRLIADVCGLEAVQKMLKHLAGLSFYIPKITRLEKFVIRYVSLFPKKSIKQIAKELRVSDKYLSNFLAKAKPK